MKLMEISFCCSCGKVRDEARDGVNPDTWIDLHPYMTKHGLRHGDFLLRNTYCPECMWIIQHRTVHEAKRTSRPSGSASVRAGHKTNHSP